MPDTNLTPAEQLLYQYIGTFSRDPFKQLLARVMNCAPDRDSLEAFAKRNPDRWIKGVADLARLSGYADKIEIETTVNINLMSDSEVERKLLEITRMLEAPAINVPAAGRVIDAEVIENPQEEHEESASPEPREDLS
jgi:hypothetical protein